MTKIADRLKSAYAKINDFQTRASRTDDDILLLAVSKTKPTSDIIEAWQAGHRHFGENYVQEGVEKIAELREQCPGIHWHFIGPLQSNKTRPVAESFDWVQSIDREKIASRLNEQRPADRPPLNVLIQVNVSDEDSKSGISLADVESLAASIATMNNLQLRGLMAIPLKTDVPEEQADAFQQMHNCFLALKAQYPTVDTLSMGMSNDVEAAIQCGSTMVRLGTAIFGPRAPKTNN